MTEVDTAGELADDQNVQAGNHFRLEAGRLRQLRKHRRRLANRPSDIQQQAALGPLVAFNVVPLGPADAAEQIALAARLGQGARAWVSFGVIGVAHQGVVQLDVQVEQLLRRLQHAQRFVDDFRVDTIAGNTRILLIPSLNVGFTRPVQGLVGIHHAAARGTMAL